MFWNDNDAHKGIIKILVKGSKLLITYYDTDPWYPDHRTERFDCDSKKEAIMVKNHIMNRDNITIDRNLVKTLVQKAKNGELTVFREN